MAIYFAPRDSFDEHIIKLVDKEMQSIKLVSKTLQQGIAKALIDAKKRGVDVEVVVDAHAVSPRSGINKLVAVNLPVYIWQPVDEPSASGKKKKSPSINDSFCIFGEKIVWSGSLGCKEGKGVPGS